MLGIIVFTWLVNFYLSGLRSKENEDSLELFDHLSNEIRLIATEMKHIRTIIEKNDAQMDLQMIDKLSATESDFKYELDETVIESDIDTDEDIIVQTSGTDEDIVV
jgi:hypothetical protein